MSDIGVSLVKIQDDLNKLKLALQRGTHNDGTPIDITTIENVVERTQARVGRAIEKASRDRNSQVSTLPFLKPSRSLSPERIQLLLSDAAIQSNRRSRSNAGSPRPPGKLQPIRAQDSDADVPILRSPARDRRSGEKRILKGTIAPRARTIPAANRKDALLPTPKLQKQDIEKGLLSLCERGLILPGSNISFSRTPVHHKQARLHPSTDQHVRLNIADVDQSAGQLALIKLAPNSPPPSAVPLKVSFNESTNRKQDSRSKSGTKRSFSSNSPLRPLTSHPIHQPTPPNTSTELMECRDNSQLLYQFSSSLTKPINQMESQLSYQVLRENYGEDWGSIVSLLRHFVSVLMRFGVGYALINGSALARLAIEFPLEIFPPDSTLMECLDNKDDVISEMKTVGRCFHVPGGVNRAATRIQSSWRMFIARRRYIQTRKLKWAAGVICMSWILRMRMVGIRRTLANKRVGFVERAKNRNAELGKMWNEIQDKTHTIVHIPSLGCHSSVRAGISNLELRQSLQISRLFDLSLSSNSRILYLSALECKSDLLEYYFSILSVYDGASETPGDRFQLLVPDHMEDFHYNKLSLSTILNHSPRSIRRVRHLLHGHISYIIPDIPSIDDFAIADTLNIPILAATPEKVALFHHKSSCQRVMSATGVDTPSNATDIWTQNTLLEKLADLIIHNLDYNKWIFKTNYGMEGMGVAFCDIRDLMCYGLLQRDRQRYGDNWPQLWAHENAHTKLLIELPRFLSTRVKLADRSLHANSALYFANFYEYGGKVEAHPPTEEFTTLTVDLFIAPNGTIDFLSSGDQIFSSPFKVWGVSLPQTSIQPQVLLKITSQLTDTFLQHGIIGHVHFDLVTFFEGDTQRIWLTDIKLCPSPYIGLVKMLNCVTGGHFDTISGHYYCEVSEKKTPKYAVISNKLEHSNFSLIRYNVLFQMCKAQGIVYKNDTKNGTLFGLIDDITRRQIGMIVVSDWLEASLKISARNLSVIHQEISMVGMQGSNNFDDVIKQLTAVLRGISQE